MAKLVQEGRSIDYTPGADVASGAVVVQGKLLGVSPLDIPANTLGSIQVEGVFQFPKVTGVGTNYAAGTELYWDAAEGEATNDDDEGANALIGKSIKAVLTTDATVLIRLTQ